MNLGRIIDAVAAGDPARTALIIDGRRISYGELDTAVRQCAAALAARLAAGEGSAQPLVDRYQHYLQLKRRFEYSQPRPERA